MEKLKEKEHFKQIEDKIEQNDWKKANELLKHLIKHTIMSLELLEYKLQIDKGQQRWDDANKTAQMILLIQPDHLFAHQIRIKALSKLQKKNLKNNEITIEKCEKAKQIAQTLFPEQNF